MLQGAIGCCGVQRKRSGVKGKPEWSAHIDMAAPGAGTGGRSLAAASGGGGERHHRSPRLARLLPVRRCQERAAGAAPGQARAAQFHLGSGWPRVEARRRLARLLSRGGRQHGTSHLGHLQPPGRVRAGQGGPGALIKCTGMREYITLGRGLDVAPGTIHFIYGIVRALFIPRCCHTAARLPPHERRP